MATYDKEIDYDQSATYFKLKERHIYGSSRVGVRSSDVDLLALPNQGYSMRSVHYSIGSRTYELSNHLGNVLSVISDKVIPYFEGGDIAEMRADIRVAQDYSPFGVTLSGRNFVVDERYRYGFNGMEKDDEVKGAGNSYTTEFRQYDPRLGRWLTVDPMASQAAGWTPYRAFFDNPIINTDKSGLYEVDVKLSSKTKSDVKQKHKDSGVNGWRQNAKSELNEIKQNHIKQVVTAISEARQAVEADNGILQDTEKILGAQKGADDYNNYFENNGKGPKITIDEDFGYSGETYKGKLTIGGLVHSDESRKATVLHEYAHYAKQKLGVIGDDSKTGYDGISMTTSDQLKTINEAIRALPISEREKMSKLYQEQKNLDSNNTPIKVEGGYVLEKIVFGKITHRPISQ